MITIPKKKSPRSWPSVFRKDLKDIDEANPKERDMISFFLAAPGLMGETVRHDVHSQLLQKKLLRPAGHSGDFTWDGSENAITINPRWPKSYSWIDYVLWIRGSSAIPSYMDNRAIRLTSPVPFPELANYLTTYCLESSETPEARAVRNRKAALRETLLCLKHGMPCDVHGSQMTKYPEYVARIREALHIDEPDDDLIWGRELFKILQFPRSRGHPADRKIIEMMDPILAPLFSESSDHYAVLSNISFERSRKARSDTNPSLKSSSTSPFSNVSRKPDIDAAKFRPSKSIPDNSFRIMTQNMHFRPYDIRVHSYASKCDLSAMALNMQEMRAIVFVEALKNMPPSEFPQILCLQETQHHEANAVLQAKLGQTRLRNSVTSLNVHRRSVRPDVHWGQVIWSGLQLWTSWDILDSTFMLFTETVASSTRGAVVSKLSAMSKFAVSTSISTAKYLGSALGITEVPKPRLSKAPQLSKATTPRPRKSPNPDVPGIPSARSTGVDKLFVNKGFLYALLQDPATGFRVQVIVTHPSPYVMYGLVEGAVLGSRTPEEVAEVHREQLNVLKGFIEGLLSNPELEDIPIFVTGDLNINRYAVRPDSVEEQNSLTAKIGRSGEFDQVLRKLHAAVPEFVADSNTDRWVPKDQLESARQIEAILNRRFPPYAHDTRRFSI